MTACVLMLFQTASHCHYGMSRGQETGGDAHAHQSKAYHPGLNVRSRTIRGPHRASSVS